MSIRAGLLALLAERPKYGYQLKSEFDADTAGVWSLNVGQVYTTLDRLERDGCVVAAVATPTGPGADGPDTADAERRKLYHLTDVGHRELTAWFAEPVGEAAPPRDELLIKVLLATKTRDVNVQAVIDTEREALHEVMRRHRRHRQRLNGDGDLTADLLLDALLARTESSLRWLDVVEERLRAARDADRRRSDGASIAPTRSTRR